MNIIVYIVFYLKINYDAGFYDLLIYRTYPNDVKFKNFEELSLNMGKVIKEYAK